MIVQFMVRNVLSFKDETILDMRAINAYKEHQSNLVEFSDKNKILKVASIYGANASGKSNLVFAFVYFQRIIEQSFNNVPEGEESAIHKFYEPFKLGKETDTSEFQIVAILDGIEYRYGFEYNEKSIVSEWLYKKNINTNRQSTIMERSFEDIQIGNSIKKQFDKFKEQVPKETLALSFFNKLKIDENIFQDVFKIITNTAVIGTKGWDNFDKIEKLLPIVLDNDKEMLVNFLQSVDTGIKDIECKKDGENYEFYAIHKGEDGDDYSIDLTGESEGTLKCILVFIYVQVTLLNNVTMIVDELNNKLHPLLLKYIVDLFYESDSKAQLIYTTHDTTWMDKRFFRRDQIWFVQKDEFGKSELSSLSDFKVRPDASFEKDYLAGVYGGIPIIKNFDMEEGE